MKTMGAFYRGYFAARGLFPSPGCGGADQTYFRADSAQRTLVTAQALAEGMLPGCKVQIHALAEGERDSLFDATDGSAAGSDAKLALAAVAGRLGPKPEATIDAYRHAFDTLTRLLTGDGKATHSIFEEPLSLGGGKAGVTMNGPLSLASTLSEDLLLEYADGMTGDRLGWGRLTAANLLEVLSLHTAYADLMRRTPYLARTRGVNLMNGIVRSLEQAVTGKAAAGAIGSPQTALLMISGHDTNLSNLSGMLGLSWLLPGYQPDDAPPGSALIFTLWRSPDSGRYSVRLQFAAQTPDQMHDSSPDAPAMAELFVPGCSTSAPGYPCPWEAFRAIAK
jgi:4-phytase/acid phosphatase